MKSTYQNKQVVTVLWYTEETVCYKDNETGQDLQIPKAIFESAFNEVQAAVATPIVVAGQPEGAVLVDASAEIVPEGASVPTT